MFECKQASFGIKAENRTETVVSLTKTKTNQNGKYANKNKMVTDLSTETDWTLGSVNEMNEMNEL